MPVPPWLEPLLSTAFFTLCRIHGDAAARGECNLYCLDCGGDSFCFYCRSSKHKDHQVIQLVGIKRNIGNTSFNIEGKSGGLKERRKSKEEEEELREGLQEDMNPYTPPQPPSNARRRKGIPHRAPFGS